MPDLEFFARLYINELDRGDNSASINFMNYTLLGINQRPRGVKDFLSSFWGNSHHLWMWDKKSLGKELENVGFKEIRVCEFNDSEDKMFNLVEDKDRFQHAVAIECRK